MNSIKWLFHKSVYLLLVVLKYSEKISYLKTIFITFIKIFLNIIVLKPLFYYAIGIDGFNL